MLPKSNSTEIPQQKEKKDAQDLKLFFLRIKHKGLDYTRSEYLPKRFNQLLTQLAERAGVLYNNSDSNSEKESIDYTGQIPYLEVKKTLQSLYTNPEIRSFLIDQVISGYYRHVDFFELEDIVTLDNDFLRTNLTEDEIDQKRLSQAIEFYFNNKPNDSLGQYCDGTGENAESIFGCQSQAFKNELIKDPKKLREIYIEFFKRNITVEKMTVKISTMFGEGGNSTFSMLKYSIELDLSNYNNYFSLQDSDTSEVLEYKKEISNQYLITVAEVIQCLNKDVIQTCIKDMKDNNKQGLIIATLQDFGIKNICNYVSLDDLKQGQYFSKTDALITLCKYISVSTKEKQLINIESCRDYVQSTMGTSFTIEQVNQITEVMIWFTSFLEYNYLVNNENPDLIKRIVNQVIVSNTKLSTSDLCQKIKLTFEQLQKLFECKDRLVSIVSNKLFLLVFESEKPEELVEFIIDNFTNPQLPDKIKFFILFNYLYPDSKIDDILNSHKHLSPVLKNAQVKDRRLIIWQDILKSMNQSAGNELEEYVEKINYIDLQLINKLDTLTGLEIKYIENTIKSILQIYKNKKGVLSQSPNISKLLDNQSLSIQWNMIRRLFRCTEGKILGNQLKDMFDMTEKLDSYMNQNLESESTNQILKQGGLIKEINSSNLPAILETGIISREHIGEKSKSDSTPFDTDFYLLDNNINIKDVNKTKNSLIVESYGDITLYIEPNEYITEIPSKENQYELIKSQIVSDQHYGIRTALPSQYITKIILNKNTQSKGMQEKIAEIKLSLINKSMFIPIFASDGNCVFTKEDFEHFTKIKVDISREQLNQKSSIYDLDSILSSLGKDIAQRLPQSVGVVEGYTLEEHIRMVFGQFKKYFRADELPISLSFMTLFLIAHDIGKVDAVKYFNSKELQHKMNSNLVQSIFEQLGFDPLEIKLAKILSRNDSLGHYLQNKSTLEDCADSITAQSLQCQMPVSKYYDILKIYFMSDASSYTINAGGKRGLDNLFIFKDQSLKLNEELQGKIVVLEELLFAKN
jgi:hypothetical protein